MNATLFITEVISLSGKTYVFNQTYALALVNDNIQNNMDYLAAVVPSNTVLNQDMTKMDTSGF